MFRNLVNKRTRNWVSPSVCLFFFFFFLKVVFYLALPRFLLLFPRGRTQEKFHYCFETLYSIERNPEALQMSVCLPLFSVSLSLLSVSCVRPLCLYFYCPHSLSFLQCPREENKSYITASKLVNQRAKHWKSVLSVRLSSVCLLSLCFRSLCLFPLCFHSLSFYSASTETLK